MLTIEEIVKKVKELEIKSRKITDHLFSGEYHSAFKGRGMSFREVREYAAGDDIRFIDWNVSARFSHPFTKLFEEERELTMMLLIDVSASSLFGTTRARKKEVVTEIAALLAFSAVTNNDKVGVIFFSDKVEKYIAPRKGKQHVLYIVREMLTAEPKQKGTDIGEALRFLNNASRQNSICFLLSDFLDGNFADTIKVAGRRNDLIGIKVYDKMDMQLPDVGLVQVSDAETGKTVWLDTGNDAVRSGYEKKFFQHTEWCKNAFVRAGSDLLHVRTDDDYVKILQKFFIGRS